jgi:DNA-binding NarL/FixJ family response regulator
LGRENRNECGLLTEQPRRQLHGSQGEGFGVRILVVDDNVLARDAIRDFLLGSGDFDGLYTACDGRQAVEVVTAHRPDVMVIDIGLPEGGGLTIADRVRRLFPETAVVVLADHDNAQYRQAAQECGASAFVAKQRMATQLLPAIVSVGSGSRELELERIRKAVATPPRRGD